MAQLKVSLAAAELWAGDGGGDGNIEALGGVILTITGDEEAMIYTLTDLRGDTIALVAHDDESVRGEGVGIDVFTIKQGAVDGEVGR